MVDLLLHPLDAVVPVGRPVVRRVHHDLSHLLRRLDLRQLQQETCLEVLERAGQEAGQSGECHECDQILNMLMVSPGQKEALDDEGEVELEGLGVDRAPHNADHFVRQFEVRAFELEVVGWRNIEYKPEVNVHQAPPLFVDQYVAVVAVLHLQQVGDY